MSPPVARRLAEHTQQFFWLQNDYEHVRKLSEQHFLGELRHWLADPAAATRELASHRFVRASVATKRRRLQARRLSSRLRRTLATLVTLGSWRDDRKAYQQMANGVIHDFVNEFSRRSGRSVRDWEECFYWEIRSPQIFPLSVAELQRRFGPVMYTNDPRRRASTINGQRAVHLRTSLNQAIHRHHAGELKGMPACVGKVTGKARVILGKKEFSSMAKGDILVTANTRPEFVPIMKLASAIVTEEGGLTSHAAIVSRELKIPGVVGVQGILEAVKSGDRIFVDAFKGIISKRS